MRQLPGAAPHVQPSRLARPLALRRLLPEVEVTPLFYTLLPGRGQQPPRLLAVTAVRPRTWLGQLLDGTAEGVRPKSCHGRWKCPAAANRALRQAQALFAGYRQNRSAVEAQLKKLDDNHDRRLAEILGTAQEDAPHDS